MKNIYIYIRIIYAYIYKYIYIYYIYSIYIYIYREVQCFTTRACSSVLGLKLTERDNINTGHNLIKLVALQI